MRRRSTGTRKFPAGNSSGMPSQNISMIAIRCMRGLLRMGCMRVLENCIQLEEPARSLLSPKLDIRKVLRISIR
jgi:hypothetical protein